MKRYNIAFNLDYCNNHNILSYRDNVNKSTFYNSVNGIVKETIEQLYNYSFNPIIFFCTTEHYLNKDWIESNFNSSNFKYEFIFCHNFEETFKLINSVSYYVDINPKNVECWMKYVNNVILVNTDDNIDVKVTDGIIRVDDFEKIYEIYVSKVE